MVTRTINGTALDNYIFDPDTENAPEDTTINGLGGNDTIIGRHGNDILDGGLGNDEIYTVSSGYAPSPGEVDVIYGREGNDFIGVSDGGGSANVYGGPDDDIIDGRFYGIQNVGAGVSYLRGETGNDTIYLTGSDALIGGRDFAYGGEGNDIIYSNEGTQGHTVYGGPGNDFIYSKAGDDVSVGTGVDVITYSYNPFGAPVASRVIVRTFENDIDKFEIVSSPGLILRSFQSNTSTLIQAQRDNSWSTLAEVLFFSQPNMSLVIANGTPTESGNPTLRYIFS